MSYRCIHCGGHTGNTMQEAQEATGHGIGVCVSPCRWCNEGTPHTPHVCANLKTGKNGEILGEMSASVWDFMRARQDEYGHIAAGVPLTRR